MEDQDEYDSNWYGTSSYPPFHRMPMEFVGAGAAHVSRVSINQGGPAVSARAGPSQSSVSSGSKVSMKLKIRVDVKKK